MATSTPSLFISHQKGSTYHVLKESVDYSTEDHLAKLSVTVINQSTDLSQLIEYVESTYREGTTHFPLRHLKQLHADKQLHTLELIIISSCDIGGRSLLDSGNSFTGGNALTLCRTLFPHAVRGNEDEDSSTFRMVAAWPAKAGPCTKIGPMETKDCEDHSCPCKNPNQKGLWSHYTHACKPYNSKSSKGIKRCLNLKLLELLVEARSEEPVDSGPAALKVFTFDRALYDTEFIESVKKLNIQLASLQYHISYYPMRMRIRRVLQEVVDALNGNGDTAIQISNSDAKRMSRLGANNYMTRAIQYYEDRLDQEADEYLDMLGHDAGDGDESMKNEIIEMLREEISMEETRKEMHSSQYESMVDAYWQDAQKKNPTITREEAKQQMHSSQYESLVDAYWQDAQKKNPTITREEAREQLGKQRYQSRVTQHWAVLKQKNPNISREEAEKDIRTQLVDSRVKNYILQHQADTGEQLRTDEAKHKLYTEMATEGYAKQLSTVMEKNPSLSSRDALQKLHTNKFEKALDNFIQKYKEDNPPYMWNDLDPVGWKICFSLNKYQKGITTSYTKYKERNPSATLTEKEYAHQMQTQKGANSCAKNVRKVMDETGLNYEEASSEFHRRIAAMTNLSEEQLKQKAGVHRKTIMEHRKEKGAIIPANVSLDEGRNQNFRLMYRISETRNGKTKDRIRIYKDSLPDLYEAVKEHEKLSEAEKDFITQSWPAFVDEWDGTSMQKLIAERKQKRRKKKPKHPLQRLSHVDLKKNGNRYIGFEFKPTGKWRIPYEEPSKKESKTASEPVDKPDKVSGRSNGNLGVVLQHVRDHPSVAYHGNTKWQEICKEIEESCPLTLEAYLKEYSLLENASDDTAAAATVSGVAGKSASKGSKQSVHPIPGDVPSAALKNKEWSPTQDTAVEGKHSDETQSLPGQLSLPVVGPHPSGNLTRTTHTALLSTGAQQSPLEDLRAGQRNVGKQKLSRKKPSSGVGTSGKKRKRASTSSGSSKKKKQMRLDQYMTRR